MPKLGPAPLVSRRVCVVYRIVAAVAVAVEALRIIRRLDYRIRAYKPPQLRVVISGASAAFPL